jgi:hypothetical protein
MQDTKRFENQQPAAGPGLSGALGPLRKKGWDEEYRSVTHMLA